jgi:polyisoprenoid-binding protein YceI
VRYRIDSSASRFTVQAFATGLLASFGHNPTIAIRDFEGEAHASGDNLEDASLILTIGTNSMEVLDEMKRDDRHKLEAEMNDRILDTKQYPTITFTSTKIAVQKMATDQFRAEVVGELTFHGVKREYTFDARITRRGTQLRISSDFSLRQSDYGITPFKAAGGALQLKDEVKFNCDLVAQLQEEARAGG